MKRLNFINHQQLTVDVLNWESQLPVVDAFVGVPRSGLIPAAMLSLRRNVRLVPIELLREDPENCLERSPLRDNNPAMTKREKILNNKIMIVDDCTGLTSVTMNKLREEFRNTSLQIYFGAVYNANPTKAVDFTYKHVPQPRMFEWNFFRHYDMHQAMWDVDGLICEDWTGTERHQPEEYKQHVSHAKSKFIPEHPLRAVCTNRTSQWEPQTSRWLKRHDVRYQELLMYPEDEPHRRTHDQPRGKFKAEQYKQRVDCTLFVESDICQAKIITVLSGKPVLATDEMRLIFPK